MVVQTGDEGHDAPLARRLENDYYRLTALTDRHFRQNGRGWFFTGVTGLDAPTMNRAVIETADVVDIDRIVADAGAYFGERDCAWTMCLSSFRPAGRWHSELIMRGLSPTTTLDVLVRDPGPIPGAEIPPSVRLAGADEVPAFTELLMDVFRMPRRFYPALLDMTEAWRKGGARLYLAELDGAVVGTTLLSSTRGVAGIYNVGTARNARRKGVAKAMMARALYDARHADVITLQVAPEGFVEGFYLEMGFEPLYAWRFYAPRARGLFR